MIKENHTSKVNDENYTQLVSFLNHRQFQLSGMGITNKTSFDWIRLGVYLDATKPKGKRRYNAIEYIWLLMVKELRRFGFPLKSIKTLKSNLLVEVDMKDVLTALISNNDFQNDELKELQSSLKQSTNFTELAEILNQENINMVDSVLCSIITSELMEELNYNLLIKRDGRCLIETEGNIDFKKIGNEPFIRISMKEIIGNFLWNESINKLEMINKEKSKPDYSEIFDILAGEFKTKDYLELLLKKEDKKRK